jgi:hypothetical protein
MVEKEVTDIGNSIIKKRTKDAEYAERYRKAHPEKVNEAIKKYREKYPGRVKNTQKKYRETHHDLCRERTKRYQEAHRKEILEKRRKYSHSDKGKSVDRAWKEKNKEKTRGYTSKYRERHYDLVRKKEKDYVQSDKGRQRMHERRMETRNQVFSHYSPDGIKCALSSVYHPGYECTDIEVLSIDHINGGGGKHRKELKGKSGHGFYLWLIQQGFPKGYRVLCWNCQHKEKLRLKLTPGNKTNHPRKHVIL